MKKLVQFWCLQIFSCSCDNLLTCHFHYRLNMLLRKLVKQRPMSPIWSKWLMVLECSWINSVIKTIVPHMIQTIRQCFLQIKQGGDLFTIIFSHMWSLLGSLLFTLVNVVWLQERQMAGWKKKDFGMGIILQEWHRLLVTRTNDQVWRISISLRNRK